MGAIETLQKNVYGLVAFTIVLAVGLAVLVQFQSAGLVTGTANTSITTMITNLGTFPTWVGILVIVIAASAVLMYFKKKGTFGN